MDFITNQLSDWAKEGLIGAVMDNYAGMFESINSQIGDIATNVGRSPDAWQPGIFTMIRSLSDTVILPIAGMILTFVVCYELIQMIIERNNLHDFDLYALFKWLFKTCCAVFILSHTFDIVMGVFALSQSVIDSSAGVVTGSLDVNIALSDLEAMLQTMSVWGLMGLWLESFIIRLCLLAMTICIFIIIFGRLIEIYLVVSVAPIPLATVTHREWGQIGMNYLKSLFALGFQGFLIMVCVAIYAALVRGIPTAGNVHLMVWTTVGYTALLCFALFRSSILSRSLFGAH